MFIIPSLLLSFLSGKGSAFLAAATPSPLTTPNPLEKPFKVAALGADLISQTSKASFYDQISHRIIKLC